MLSIYSTHLVLQVFLKGRRYRIAISSITGFSSEKLIVIPTRIGSAFRYRTTIPLAWSWAISPQLLVVQRSLLQRPALVLRKHWWLLSNIGVRLCMGYRQCLLPNWRWRS